MKLYEGIVFVIGLVLLMASLILWSVPLQAVSWIIMLAPMYYETHKLLSLIEKESN